MFKKKANKVRDFFNITENYYQDNSTTFLRKIITSELIGTVKQKNIIDIGCGNGAISIPFLKSNHVTFLDFSMNMLEEAKNNIPINLIHKAEFINYDITFYNTSKKFDMAFLIGVLSHVDNVEMCVSKISKLLNENGICIVQITDSNKYLAKLLNVYYKVRKHFLFEPKMDYEMNVLNKDLITQTFSKFGFILNDIKYHLPSLPGFRFLPQKTRITFLMLIYKNKWISYFGPELILKFRKNL